VADVARRTKIACFSQFSRARREKAPLSRVSEEHFTKMADALQQSFPERLYLTI
jgi:hypothetical protein